MVFWEGGTVDSSIENVTEINKEKLLPSPYISTLAIGAEIDISDSRYWKSGGTLQTGYAERDNLYVFTYGRSIEEEKDENLLKSRVRMGLLGVTLLAGSNGIVLYNGCVGRPIRTSVDFSARNRNRDEVIGKIIRLKHERYPEFRYSVEPFSIANVTHPDVKMTPEVLEALDELSETGKVSIANLTILSNAVRVVSHQYEPDNNWSYRDLWKALLEKTKNDIESHSADDSEEARRARAKVLIDHLRWMNEMEEFAGLSEAGE
jgi:hypothetical protein